MSKSEITLNLERLLDNKLDPRKYFYCFEVTLGWYGDEIVDCIAYSTDREIICYEIKSSKQDFNSKSKWSFHGNRNYFVMPLEVYEQVKADIPYGIGVYVAKGNGLVNVRSCRKIQLCADKEVVLGSMLRSMQRELLKQRSKIYKLESEKVNESKDIRTI